ncbi:hypothetical protein V6R98_27095 [Agrobacterium sp. CCNWLW71]|uniref:gp53-like domain-containing protein n=1 Tax=unclassified Agrobacterium TaxID=2632611 RepID=UPI002FEF074B
MTAIYKDGTVTLIQGSPVIVGNDTGWKVALIVGGTVFVEAEGGAPLPILPDDSDGANLHPITNTQMTAAINWTGASGTYNYAIVRDMSYSRQQSANADALALYLQRLNNPSLAAVSGLVPEADSLILFTGPDTATVIQRSSLVQGVDYDADADDIVGRNLYSSEAKGFSVLVANAGDGRTAIFIKRSSTDGDWSVPFYLSGPIGPKGDAGETGIADKGAYVATDLYAARDAVLDNGSTWLARIAVPPGNPPPVLPATQNDYWRLLARRGTDGTGIGDVIGPNGGVVNNAPAAFDGTTGKLIKVITGAIAALHELVPAANKLPYFSAENGASLADLTAFARTILDDANGAAMFATMGAISGTGWMKLPNGRLMQWGSSVSTTDSGGHVGVFFPTAFSAPGAYNVVAWNGESQTAGGNMVVSQLRSAPWPQSTGFAVACRLGSTGAGLASTGVRIDWFAIGVAP